MPPEIRLGIITGSSPLYFIAANAPIAIAMEIGAPKSTNTIRMINMKIAIISYLLLSFQKPQVLL